MIKSQIRKKDIAIETEVSALGQVNITLAIFAVLFLIRFIIWIVSWIYPWDEYQVLVSYARASCRNDNIDAFISSTSLTDPADITKFRLRDGYAFNIANLYEEKARDYPKLVNDRISGNFLISWPKPPQVPEKAPSLEELKAGRCGQVAAHG